MQEAKKTTHSTHTALPTSLAFGADATALDTLDTRLQKATRREVESDEHLHEDNLLMDSWT
jgi:hypothetical protein